MEENNPTNITHRFRKTGRRDYWKIAAIIFAGLLILSVYQGEIFTGLSTADAGDKAIEYINTNLLINEKAELKGIVEENGLYKLSIAINSQELPYPLFITKNGKILIAGQTFDTAEVLPMQETQTVPKSDKPVVELYLMSFCPYGNKAEATMYPVYQLLKDKVEWKIHYIVSVDGTTVNSLHGQPEVDQDIREVCVKRDYGMDAFWKFMTYVNDNCGSNGACWEDAAKAAGADANKIKECLIKDGITLMKAEAEASSTAGASGSPTLIINGVKTNSVYSYGQSDTYKETICNAFNTAPSTCSTKLSSSSSTASSGAAAGCGTS